MSHRTWHASVLFKYRPWLQACLGCILWLSVGISDAGTTCHGHFINPFTDVCWSCLLPISLGANTLLHRDLPDTPNGGPPVCACPSSLGIPKVGLSIGFWEPLEMVDVTRTPYCLVNLGGVQLSMGHLGHGDADTESDNPHSFYYVHVYQFPLFSLLHILMDTACAQKSEVTLLYASELDPVWHDEELAAVMHPESFLFANDIAQASCIADSLAATTGLPIDKLFWCAGSQGSLYPQTGFVTGHIGGIQASSLLAERALAHLQSSLLLANDEYGASDICQAALWQPLLKKTHYRLQLINPAPSHCHPIGRPTALWESGYEFPAGGEDFGYLVWHKRHCCLF